MSKKKNKFRDEQPSNWLLNAIMLMIIWGGIVGAGILAYYAIDLPDIKQVAQQQRRPAVTLLSEDGTVIARYGDQVGARVTLADVPPTLIQAIISIEDRRFYDHFGVDVFGLLRAAGSNLIAGHVVQGGSTLTQQLAKNLFLSPERTFKRKVQEMLLALWLERTYTKDQILTAYLNRVYLGSGTYGVDAAAQTYFAKPVKDINLRESAIIAGLLRAPSRYAPTNDMAESLSRAKVVLNAMVDAGYITESQRDAAIGNDAALPPRKPGVGGDGRYFADWIAEQVGGLIQSAPQDLVVVTTLDFRLQRAAERTLNSVLATARDRNVSQAALVTLGPDGAVKAMVGGADYYQSQFNRITQAMRQPGSSFKPVIYLTAIEQGMSPDDIWEDAPITIGDWSPENYEKEYEGRVSAREALAKSINTVAVRVLQKVGVGRAIQMARSLGISSKMEPELSLALGTNTLTPLELTGAYATIAAGGRFVTPYAIVEVRNKEGQVLYRRTDANAPVMVDPKYVSTLVDMMTSVVSYGTGKRAALDRPVAGKTGTTSDFHDAWFVGFTADYTTGVWMGNDDNKPMKHVSGGTFPTQLWHDYMVEAEQGLSPRPLLSNLPTGPVNGGEPPESGSHGDDLGALIQNLMTSSPASPPAKSEPTPAPKQKPEYGTGQGVLGTLPAER
jgi:penicillin-binding protein 1A